MGTHPIFESDFDCLTDFEKMDIFLKWNKKFKVTIPENDPGYWDVVFDYCETFLHRCILTRPSYCMNIDECISELNNLRLSCSSASTFIKNSSTTIEIVKALLDKTQGQESSSSNSKIYKFKREKKLYLNDDNMVEIKYNPVFFSLNKQEFNIAYEQFYTRNEHLFESEGNILPKIHEWWKEENFYSTSDGKQIINNFGCLTRFLIN